VFRTQIESAHRTVPCDTYHGATLTAAFGLYPACAELHGEVGNTEVWDINIFDIIIYIASALSGGDN